MAPHTHVIDPSGARRPGEPSAAGTLLTVKKNAVDRTKIDLAWGAGCASGATGFAVYEGTLGPPFTSHAIFGGACGISCGTSAARRSWWTRTDRSPSWTRIRASG